jgi:hypothetical protein
MRTIQHDVHVGDVNNYADELRKQMNSLQATSQKLMAQHFNIMEKMRQCKDSLDQAEHRQREHQINFAKSH